MNLTLFKIGIVISIIIILIILRQKILTKSGLYTLPNDIYQQNIETYLFKTSRLKKINLEDFTDTVYLIPKFSSTYYNSAYNNICDLRENSIASLYLTTIGNINLSSKILHSMIYIMMSRGWNPLSDRLANYQGLPNIYNIDILESTSSLPQKYSDASSIYLSIALMKFLLTYDERLSQNTRYPQIKILYITAAYDLWKYIVTTQKCATGEVFHNSKNNNGENTNSFTTGFHIALYACCNLLELIVTKYGLIIDTSLNITQVRDICRNVIDKSNFDNNILYKFNDCKLEFEGDLENANKSCEDYLNLLLVDYDLDKNALIDNMLDQFYVPDTDYFPTGCGPGVYNIDCKNKDTDVGSCYNIKCDPKIIPSSRISYGLKWSVKGSGISFAMSSLGLMALAINNNFTKKALNVKESLIKLYREYQGLFILGGFQEELAFSENPFNTGTGDSIFRYPSLLSTVMTGFAFLYMRTQDKNVNYLSTTSFKNYNISNSILDFDDSPLFLLL